MGKEKPKKLCKHCGGDTLDTDNMIGPWHGLRCSACNHYHIYNDTEFIIFHDNKCGCDEKGTEKGKAYEKSDPASGDSVGA